jgi:hypothetical protein
VESLTRSRAVTKQQFVSNEMIYVWLFCMQFTLAVVTYFTISFIKLNLNRSIKQHYSRRSKFRTKSSHNNKCMVLSGIYPISLYLNSQVPYFRWNHFTGLFVICKLNRMLRELFCFFLYWHLVKFSKLLILCTYRLMSAMRKYWLEIFLSFIISIALNAAISKFSLH